MKMFRRNEEALLVSTNMVKTLFETLLERQPSESDLVEFSNREMSDVLKAILQSPEFKLKDYANKSKLLRVISSMQEFYNWFPFISSYTFEDDEEISSRNKVLNEFFNSKKFQPKNSISYLDMLHFLKSSKTLKPSISVVVFNKSEEDDLNFIYHNLIHLMGYFKIETYQYREKDSRFILDGHYFFNYIRNELSVIELRSEYTIVVFK